HAGLFKCSAIFARDRAAKLKDGVWACASGDQRERGHDGRLPRVLQYGAMEPQPRRGLSGTNTPKRCHKQHGDENRQRTAPALLQTMAESTGGLISKRTARFRATCQRAETIWSPSRIITVSAVASVWTRLRGGRR